jgi:hypothetical protein
MTVRRHFPLDGEYTIRFALAAGPTREPHELEVTLDGERIGLFTIKSDGREGRGGGGGAQYARREVLPLQLSHRIAAGPRTLTATFIKKTSAVSEDLLPPFTRSGQGNAPDQPSLASVTISGPYKASRPNETPSRRRIFVCHPANDADEGPCATQILSTLARRAYRRPVNEADVQVLTRFYDEGRAEGGFEAGIQRALERLLVSPSFLFRAERQPSTTAGGGAVRPIGNAPQPRTSWRISDVELASRLSFFLWSSIPDDQLLDLAIQGKLSDSATLERQVHRMLADPRSRALVTNFAGQWLFLRNVDGATPDPRVFPDFDDGLRRAMRRETELFFESIVGENKSVLEFLTAKYTFVNERLAKHYGVPNVYGDHFRRVSLEGQPRAGLLGQASILTVTSYAHRTSPVLRGKWMLENVLGTPPPPPPPNVPTLQESSKTGKPLTMREAMVQHRANPVCSTCHSMMDPLGFAFENYDAVGRWRTHSGANMPVDASGVLADGTKFDGASGLVAALMRRPEQFVTTLTERLLTYALGRGVEFYDAPAIREIVRHAAQDEYRFSSLVLGIARSVPFQWRTLAPPASPAQPVAMRR